MRYTQSTTQKTTIGVQSALERSEWRFLDALLLTQQEGILIDAGGGRWAGWLLLWWSWNPSLTALRIRCCPPLSLRRPSLQRPPCQSALFCDRGRPWCSREAPAAIRSPYTTGTPRQHRSLLRWGWTRSTWGKHRGNWHDHAYAPAYEPVQDAIGEMCMYMIWKCEGRLVVLMDVPLAETTTRPRTVCLRIPTKRAGSGAPCTKSARAGITHKRTHTGARCLWPTHPSTSAKCIEISQYNLTHHTDWGPQLCTLSTLGLMSQMKLPKISHQRAYCQNSTESGASSPSALAPSRRYVCIPV